MEQNKKRANRIVVVIVILLAIGIWTWFQLIQRRHTSSPVHIPQVIYYESDTPKTECCLCGNGKGTLIPAYKNQDNVAIISLNTFQLSYVELNRYNDCGQPIHEKGSHSTQINNTGEGGFSTFISEDANRGYATGMIMLNSEEKLELEKAASFLCNDCLNYTLEQSWSNNPYGIGIIDFRTREIRLFEEDLTAFSFGDYYISCDTIMEDNNCKSIDLLIFYCPPRYD